MIKVTMAKSTLGDDVDLAKLELEDKFSKLENVLKNATMVRLETTYADRKTQLRARDYGGETVEYSLAELGLKSASLQLHDERFVADMWATAHDYPLHPLASNNIGLTIEEGTLHCTIKKGSDDIFINCSLPR